MGDGKEIAETVPNEKAMAGLNDEERRRYSRHIMLPEIGKTGQEKLKAARVLCLGAGGLGSPPALYLPAAGVGPIGIGEDGRAALFNLHRQLPARTKGFCGPQTRTAPRRFGRGH